MVSQVFMAYPMKRFSLILILFRFRKVKYRRCSGAIDLLVGTESQTFNEVNLEIHVIDYAARSAEFICMAKSQFTFLRDPHQIWPCRRNECFQDSINALSFLIGKLGVPPAKLI